jgi:hypothetical protein
MAGLPALPKAGAGGFGILLLGTVIHNDDVRVADELLVGVRPGVLDRDLEAAPCVAVLAAQPVLQVVDQSVGRYPMQPLQQAGAEDHPPEATRAQHFDLLMRGDIKQTPEAGIGGARVHAFARGNRD